MKLNRVKNNGAVAVVVDMCAVEVTFVALVKFDDVTLLPMLVAFGCEFPVTSRAPT